MTTTQQPLTIAQVIREVLLRELAARSEMLDKAVDLGEITVSVKLEAGHPWVRGVVWQEERVCRSRSRRP